MVIKQRRGGGSIETWESLSRVSERSFSTWGAHPLPLNGHSSTLE